MECAPDLLVPALGLEQLDQRVAHRAPAVVQVLQLVVGRLVVARRGGPHHDSPTAPRGGETFAASIATDLC